MECCLELFKNVFKRKTEKSDRVEIRWSRTHLTILEHYFSQFSMTCDFDELLFAALFSETLWTQHGESEISAKILLSFAQELQGIFMVPSLKSFHSENPLWKHRLLEAFIGFLLQLLDHISDSIVIPCKYGINSLEKELRFLLTVLGDSPSMLCASDIEEFQNVLADFEAVANEAGSLIHSLYFSLYRVPREMDEGIVIVLNRFDLLKAHIMKFLDLAPFVSRSAFTTPKAYGFCLLLHVDSLISDLENLLNRDDNPIADVKDQLEILHQGLIPLRSSIKHMRSPQLAEIEEVKEITLRIGEMAQEVKYLIVSYIVGDAPSWYLNNRLTHVNRKIEEHITMECQKVTKVYKSGNVDVKDYFSSHPSLQAKRNAEVDGFTVGFEDKETYILDQLVGGTERLQVISIFGMPGLGKTTLAKTLYNHPSVIYWFDRRAWYVVSQIYSRQSVLASISNDIASELRKDGVSRMVEEERLVEHIYKTLKGRRYLIVMDDVWDLNVWDELLRCFPDDGNGSRIMFTTRNRDVAPPNSTIFRMPSLTNDQCWDLLEKKVFDDKPCPPELLGIGKKIAANCSGLPLAVVVIAGILSTMDKEKKLWEEVSKNLASYFFDGSTGEVSVKRILELSYKHLPEYLKPCFLYFGAFKEDQEIPARKLIRLWVAEGFILKEKQQSAEKVAEEYLRELVDKSLVMVARRRLDGSVKTCIIHDLLRDLCWKTCEEENFLGFVENTYYSSPNKDDRLRALESSLSWSYWLFMRSSYGGRMQSPLHVDDMRLLRVLHYFNHRHMYLTGFEYLASLRYLIVNGDLPPSIGSLTNLEYLDVETYPRVFLTPAIMKMKKLRYIHVFSGLIYHENCDISQTNTLESLSRVVIEEPRDEEMLKCSPHLCKLKCRYQCSSSSHFDLTFLSELETLSLTVGPCEIKEIGFPSSIKKLDLGSPLFLCNFPAKLLPIIGGLENLEYLKLGPMRIEEERWETRDGGFRKLKFLYLRSVFFTQWNVASSEHFPKLQRLVLSYCEYLQEIPYEIGEIATLQLIQVNGDCEESLEKSAKRILQEQREMGNEELKVILSKTPS